MIGLTRPIYKHINRAFCVEEIRARIKAKKEVRAAFSENSHPPIIIYQMGKVGSSTVFRTLLKSNIRHHPLQLHFLSDDLKRIAEVHKQAGIYPTPFHVLLGMQVRKQLPAKVYIVTLVREPIARFVSNIFQNPFFVSEKFTDGGVVDTTQVIAFLEEELSKPNALDYVFQWFDKELMKVFDIDVFSQPFPLDSGYSFYKKNNVDVLLIRMEDLSKVGGEAISSFLGLNKQIKIEKANIRSKSLEAEKYREVLNGVRLSREICEKIYASKFATHFYSPEMIDQFVNHWTRGNS